MADDRESSAAVVLAFLSGAALGAVAALLLAPESSNESHERLHRYARRAEDRLHGMAGRAGQIFEEVVEQGKDFVETEKSVLRDAFEAGRQAMREERDRMRGGGTNQI
ncbi:MAG: hypothetical protein FJ244_04850 [Nitrospira sp.]|nr:hypothetical protein [Nitrospira sp.]